MQIKSSKTYQCKRKCRPHISPYPFIKNYFINHNLSSPLFLIFISSVLYFIKKINIENSVNAAVIIANGINID